MRILLTMYSMHGMGQAGFKSGANAFYFPKLHVPLVFSTVLTFIYFLSVGWYCGARVIGLIGYQSLFPSLHCE